MFKFILKKLNIYLKSFINYIWLSIKVSQTSKKLRYLFSGISFSNIYLICPGPSALETVKELNLLDINNSCIIYVNHGLGLIKSIKHKLPSFILLADSSRAKQVSKTYSAFIKEVMTIYAPAHLHQKQTKLLNNFDLYLKPNYIFNLNYGLASKINPAKFFKPLSKNPSFYGFGTLAISLQLACLFKPKNIVIYGCDFRANKKNQWYFDEKVPLGVERDKNAPIIESDINTIKKIIENNQISITFKN